ncbi:MAG: dihydrofolate reductase [Flavobacteriaceae bacterium]|jgi:dihydrofolate reductase|nr:dihydrofolate reductase [Flavobacteriaceae bacterium]
MSKTIIVAVDENNAIGKDNRLLWHLPDDLKRFKKLTQNHAVIMGRKTFESIGRPLPNRLNIVVSQNSKYSVPDGVQLVHSLEEAVEEAEKYSKNLFVIGGGKIYDQMVNLADTIEMTLVYTKIKEADTFFPELNPKIWQKTFEEFHQKNEKHLYDFTFLTYEKRH